MSEPALPHVAPDNRPRHIAVIMDGNGRWARKRGAARIFGHRNAIRAVRETIEAAGELGVEYLTLFAFSTENWRRPPDEVAALMDLLVQTLGDEMKTLHKHGIRLHAIGDLARLPPRTHATLTAAIEESRANPRMTVALALNYGARADILAATRRLVADAAAGRLRPEDVDEATFARSLSTADMPDPELLVRTSGEMRVSNFLLWEIAYAEIYVSPKLWPDFRKADLYEAVADFQRRERRFGLTSEQLEAPA